jgi:hypothetical protein
LVSPLNGRPKAERFCGQDEDKLQAVEEYEEGYFLKASQRI